MPKTKNTTPLITTLPSDQNLRNILQATVLDMVASMKTIKQENSDISEIKKQMKDDHNICPKFLTMLAKRELDAQESNKLKEQLEEKLEQIEEADILMKRK